ncbi:MAG: 3D-(3,5/4)-trihydroxycyclohexane-1,2-dione acylhydrolase (decyclizing), partial [Candidatus Marinimicrobia bacterium]|nr:3D-(3,5/4)-trihydroxycyclohexane-1,2-dione acylhydrolase (decyclizing) [Candidatus Neomarinimicrobiota bacterium]
QAGKGSLNWKHDKNLQGIGVTGTSAANRIAKEADLVIAIGTRLSDFTTASKTQFQNPEVRFIGINVAPFDAGKQSALMLVGDAKATLERLNQMLSEKSYSVSPDYEETIQKLISEWHKESDRIFSPGNGEKVSQGEIIGILNEFMTDKDTLVCAAGSLPGDLHKLWRAENGDQYHMEYGYSCMGYEIAGGLGVRFAKEEGDVFVMVGDGSYLMMHTEIVTSLQEDKKLIIILVDNHGYGSIDGLSKSLGSMGFGNKLRRRDPKTGKLTGDFLEIDFVENVISLGAEGIRAGTREEFNSALKKARENEKTTAIIIELEPSDVPGYESWWDVPIAEVSEMQTVQQARKEYEEKVKKERYF